MSIFKKLFGVGESEIKQSCIILPCITKNERTLFDITQFEKGKLYATANTSNFSVIYTGIGAPLVGDAVLNLKDTPCRNIVLFGCCGLFPSASDVSIGDIVVPTECWALESFSEMLLTTDTTASSCKPSKPFLDSFLQHTDLSSIHRVTCATVGSLFLEPRFIEHFQKKAPCIADMECSAFFAASEYTGHHAFSLHYVTDIVRDQPFYCDQSDEQKHKISTSKKRATQALCRFLSNLQ